VIPQAQPPLESATGRAVDRAAAPRTAWRTVLLALACWLAVAGPGQAQDGVINREYDIKAAYLYNFARYVEWPEDHVLTTDDQTPAFVIGIVGDNPFGDTLAAIARQKRVNDLPIVIRYVRKADDSVRCHMLFVPAGTKRELAAAVHRAVRDLPVLTVGETEHYLRSGGTISFFVESNKVRFEIDPDRAAAARLKISSKLLNIGRVTRSPAAAKPAAGASVEP